MNGLEAARFHDARLKEVVVRWGEGDVLVRVRTCEHTPRNVTVHCKGLVAFDCPRQEPWGPSVHVNSICQKKVEEGLAVEIEMQTGDVLKVVAKSVDLVEDSVESA